MTINQIQNQAHAIQEIFEIFPVLMSSSVQSNLHVFSEKEFQSFQFLITN